MIFFTVKNICYAVFLTFLLSACTSAELAVDIIKKQTKKIASETTPSQQKTHKEIKPNPVYKVGKPYNISGIWYYPERNLTYDETGIGSWYGDEFSGRLTANGEIFDPSKVTAAHKTLPMPSVVRVTNLDNGKSLVVRVNDRGPFVAGRIIDLSREAARLIGFKEEGIARVRVQILAEQSLRLEALAKRGEFPSFSVYEKEEMPDVVAATEPRVSLKSTKKTNVKSKKSQSALDLITKSRVGEVISVIPISTKIWVQVGAFHAETSANSVLKRIKSIGDGEVSQVNVLGKTFFRVRLGPVEDVAAADQLLHRVVNTGFSGARIIVD